MFNLKKKKKKNRSRGRIIFSDRRTEHFFSFTVHCSSICFPRKIGKKFERSPSLFFFFFFLFFFLFSSSSKQLSVSAIRVKIKIRPRCFNTRKKTIPLLRRSGRNRSNGESIRETAIPSLVSLATNQFLRDGFRLALYISRLLATRLTRFYRGKNNSLRSIVQFTIDNYIIFTLLHAQKSILFSIPT